MTNLRCDGCKRFVAIEESGYIFRKNSIRMDALKTPTSPSLPCLFQWPFQVFFFCLVILQLLRRLGFSHRNKQLHQEGFMDSTLVGGSKEPKFERA